MVATMDAREVTVHEPPAQRIVRAEGYDEPGRRGTRCPVCRGPMQAGDTGRTHGECGR